MDQGNPKKVKKSSTSPENLQDQDRKVTFEKPVSLAPLSVEDALLALMGGKSQDVTNN
jgi:hypothetical protein